MCPLTGKKVIGNQSRSRDNSAQFPQFIEKFNI